MRKITLLLMSLFLGAALTACGNSNTPDSGQTSLAVQESRITETTETTPELSMQTEEELTKELTEKAETSAEAPVDVSVETPEDTPSENPDGNSAVVGQKMLVVYYSASGNTEVAANYIAEATGADLFELIPVNPYSDADLNWRDEDSRVVYEYEHPDEREVKLTETTVSDWDSYDTVFIGYPIWWEIAAWPVNDFVKSNDFTGKTVIPFCTSSSSEIGESGNLLAEAAETGNWLEGGRFQSKPSKEAVQTWIENFEWQSGDKA